MIPQHGGGWSNQGPVEAVLHGLRSAACASRRLAQEEGYTFYITESPLVGAICVLPAGYGCAAITRCESGSRGVDAVVRGTRGARGTRGLDRVSCAVSVGEILLGVGQRS